MDTKGWGDGGLKWEVGIDIYAGLCIKQITNENHCIAQEVYSMLRGALNGKEIQQ